MIRLIWLEVHAAAVVAVVLVVDVEWVDVAVDVEWRELVVDVDGAAGTKTTSFMCSRNWQGNWKGGVVVLVSECVDDRCVVVDVVVVEVLVDVDVVVVEAVVVHVLPERLKLPCKPIATRLTGPLPVLLTWTVKMVVVPETARETSLAAI